MQHDVDVGTAVATIDDVVRADLGTGLELVENKNFSVTRGGASDGLNLAAAFVLEFRSVNVVRRNDPLERRLDDFN